MREGSVVVAAVLLTGAAAYWSTHSDLGNWREAEPREEVPAPAAAVEPIPPSLAPGRSASAASLDVGSNLDAAGKAAVCAELQEVIRGVEAALRDPRSKATVEQLTAQRQAHLDKRVALGC